MSESMNLTPSLIGLEEKMTFTKIWVRERHIQWDWTSPLMVKESLVSAAALRVAALLDNCWHRCCKLWMRWKYLIVTPVSALSFPSMAMESGSNLSFWSILKLQNTS
jgi:hypothetical protein